MKQWPDSLIESSYVKCVQTSVQNNNVEEALAETVSSLKYFTAIQRHTRRRHAHFPPCHTEKHQLELGAGDTLARLSWTGELEVSSGQIVWRITSLSFLPYLHPFPSCLCRAGLILMPRQTLAPSQGF